MPVLTRLVMGHCKLHPNQPYKRISMSTQTENGTAWALVTAFPSTANATTDTWRAGAIPLWGHFVNASTHRITSPVVPVGLR